MIEKGTLMRYLLLFLYIMTTYISVALAAEPVPGNACNPDGIVISTAEGNGGHFMICKGGMWKAVYSYDAAGALTTLGNQNCASGQVIKFNGNAWVCAEDENDEGLTEPPVCTGANAALQWTGAAWGCATIAGGGGGGPPIVNGNHTQQQCIDAGGTINLSDFGGNILCAFSGATCPSGWVSYGRWYRSARTCTGSGTCGSSCTLPAGWFTTTGARSCSYKTGNAPGMGCGVVAPSTCTQASGAGVTTVACY